MTDANGHLELGGYVLGQLDADARRHFGAHLDACDACRWELTELRATARLLRRASPPVTPPPDLEVQVLAAVERAAMASAEPAPARTVPKRRRRLRPAFAAGFGVLAATAAIALLALRVDGPAGELELRATLASPAGTGAAVEVRRTGIGRVVRLRTDELPILPKGEYYELWFVGPRDSPAAPNRISAGTFHPDEQGRSNVTFAAAVDPGAVPGAERHRRAGRRRSAPERARGAPVATLGIAGVGRLGTPTADSR